MICYHLKSVPLDAIGVTNQCLKSYGSTYICFRQREDNTYDVDAYFRIPNIFCTEFACEVAKEVVCRDVNETPTEDDARLFLWYSRMFNHFSTK